MSIARARGAIVASLGMAVLGTAVLGGCASRDLSPQVGTAIEQLLSSAPSGTDPHVWRDVQQFYTQRAFEPAWTREGHEAQAAGALRAIERAPEHGFPAADYDEAELTRMLAPEKTSIAERLGRDVQKLARLDVRVTTALLALGRDVALGRTSPQSVDPRWKARRAAPDFVATLSQAATGNVEAWLDAVRPVHPEYAALQKALADVRSQVGSEAGDEEQARRLALNLERWRWLPDDLGARHILVNIPAFHMAVREQGQPALDMKVVVGKADHETPIFSAVMSTIVFSPYWNVPDSIAEGETAPAAARDPRFLERNNIEILRRGKGGDAVVNASSVNWNDADEIKTLAFRQKPGAKNALGHVKFLFPNPYDVYLHDTPADALFARQGRALSHGCVRLEQPDALAMYVLRDDPNWDDAKIQAAMHQDMEKHVALKDPLPVHIVYFTAWPTAAGGVDTWPDVYGYDAKQASSPVKRPVGAPSSTSPK